MMQIKKYKNTDIICKNIYGTYVVPYSHNRPVVNELKKGNVYEPATLKFILKNYNNGYIVSAGTYIGDFLPAFKNIEKVLAFEPVFENYNYAKINCENNNLNNVILENCCLSNTDEIKTMIISKDKKPCGGGSYIINTNLCMMNNNVDTEKVKSFTLDNYLLQIPENISRISIIQLDIEGHETQAIEGAIKTIELYKPILIVETKPKEYIEQKLIKLGYSYHKNSLHGNKILYISGEHNLKF